MPHKFDTPFHAVFYFDPPVVYDTTVEGRWPSLLNVPRMGVAEHEDHERYVHRLRMGAQHYAEEDAKLADGQPRPRGRPRVNQPLPGETPEALKLRLNRESQRRWRERHGHTLPADSVVTDHTALLALATWAWWEGVEAGRGNGEPPTLAAVLAQMETAAPPHSA